MADLSIIEFGVYGFIAYSGLLMLIISTIRETPQTKSQSFARAMYLIPSIICAFLLASSGQVIALYDVVIEVDDGSAGTHSGLNLNEHNHYTITLENSIWILVNFMVGIIMTFHVILQSLQLLLFRE